MLKSAAEYLLFGAILVAAIPYMQFLFAPPDGASTRWLVTIIALGVAGALRLFIWQQDRQFVDRSVD
jgi:hypothetical protein